MFFKRFYLYNSIIEYDPKNVMLTCVFLACKVTENFVSLEDFATGFPKQSPQTILALEMPVLQALRFEVYVHLPYLPLRGLRLDLQVCPCPPGIPSDLICPERFLEDPALLDSIYSGAMELADRSFFSDLILLFDPVSLAWAFTLMAARQRNVDLDQFVVLSELMLSRSG